VEPLVDDGRLVAAVLGRRSILERSLDHFQPPGQLKMLADAPIHTGHAPPRLRPSRGLSVSRGGCFFLISCIGFSSWVRAELR